MTHKFTISIRKLVTAFCTVIMLLSFLLTLGSCNKTEDIDAETAKLVFLNAIENMSAINNWKSVIISEYDDKKDEKLEATFIICRTGNLSDSKISIDFDTNEYWYPTDRSNYYNYIGHTFVGKGNDNNYYFLVKEESHEYKDGYEVLSSQESESYYDILEESDYYEFIDSYNSILNSALDCGVFGENNITEYLSDPKTKINCVKTTNKKVVSYELSIVCYEEWAADEKQYVKEHNMTVNIADGLVTNLSEFNEVFIDEIKNKDVTEKNRIDITYNIETLSMPNLSEYL